MEVRTGQQIWEDWIIGLVDDAMVTIKKYCKAHPTCEGCPFRQKFIGCSFRGKTPREWKQRGGEE